MAAIISGPDPYRELEMYLEKMNEEIGEVFDKWSGDPNPVARQDHPTCADVEGNGIADLSPDPSPPDPFKSLPARKKRQWRRPRADNAGGKFATVASSSAKTPLAPPPSSAGAPPSTAADAAGMGWAELHSFIEAQLRQLAQENDEDSGVPASPLSPFTRRSSKLAQGGAPAPPPRLQNGSLPHPDGLDGHVHLRRRSGKRPKEEKDRDAAYVLDGELVWPTGGKLNGVHPEVASNGECGDCPECLAGISCAPPGGADAACTVSIIRDLEESIQRLRASRRAAASAALNGLKGAVPSEGPPKPPTRRRRQSEGSGSGGPGNGVSNGLGPHSVGSSPVVPPRSLSRTLSDCSAADVATQTSPGATVDVSRSSSFSWLSQGHLSEEERNGCCGSSPDGGDATRRTTGTTTAATIPEGAKVCACSAANGRGGDEEYEEEEEDEGLEEGGGGVREGPSSPSSASSAASSSSSLSSTAPTSSSSHISSSPAALSSDSGESLTASLETMTSMTLSEELSGQQRCRSQSSSTVPQASSPPHPASAPSASDPSVATISSQSLPRPPRFPRAVILPKPNDLGTKSSSAPLLVKVPASSNTTSEKTKVAAENQKNASRTYRHRAQIEAAEACKWLRAAGFPQYAQMYEDMQFPLDLNCVGRDHPFLDRDSLQALFRRLHTLNHCSRIGCSAVTGPAVTAQPDLRGTDGTLPIVECSDPPDILTPARKESRCGLSSRVPSRDLGDDDDEVDVLRNTQNLPAPPPAPHPRRRVLSGKGAGVDDEEDDEEEEEEVQCALSDNWAFEPGPRRWSRVESSEARGSEDSLDEPWAADSGAEATEEIEENLSRDGLESGDTNVSSVVSRESLNEVQDPESMEQKVRELNCVDVSPTDGEALVGGSMASPEASSGKEARRLLRRLRQRTLSSEDGRAGALSDSECHTFSSATPKWQQLLMKSTYSIQPSERRLEQEHEATSKPTSLIKQRYKSRRAASLNLGTSAKPFREGLLLGKEDKEGKRPASETEMTGAIAREEEVITRTRPGRRWLNEALGERGSVYDNVPVVILNRSYREDGGLGFESHVEESIDISIPKKWLSNTTVVRWHSFQSCGADSRKRSALGRSRSDGSKASSEVKHSSRSSSRHKISTKANVQDVILFSSPSKHRRESLGQLFGDTLLNRDVESIKCSNEGIEGPRTLALHGKDVAMCVALGFGDTPILPSGDDANVPKVETQGHPSGQVLELTPIPKESKDEKTVIESGHVQTSAENRIAPKEKDSVNSKTPPLQRTPRVSEEDAPSSSSVSPSHSEDKEREFRTPHIQSVANDSFDTMKSLSKDEEDGTAISALSCGQMLVLRKLALLRLTALMERHCSSSSVVGGGSHHRSGSPSSTGASSTAGGSWSWELPRILLLRRSKAPDFKDKRVFGVPLWVCLQRSGDGIPIPPPITAALSWLRVNALNQVGLFRRSGVKSRIARLKAASEEAGWEIYSEGTIKQDELVLMDSSEESGNKAVGGAKFSYLDDQQAYDVADMVKLYFRELPEALLSSKLSDTFISVFQHVPEGQRKEAIQCLLLLLPDENREVLQTLLDFLAQVASHSSENQMTIGNLAVCLAPSLFHHHHQGRHSSQRHHSPSPSQSPSPSPLLTQPAVASSSSSTSSTSSSSSSSSTSSTSVTQGPAQNANQSGGTPKRRGLKKMGASTGAVVVVGSASMDTMSAAIGMPDPRELSQSRAAHDCLHFLLQEQNSLFRVPDEMLSCCRFSSLEESVPVSLGELGSEMGADWRAYLRACIASLLKEVRDRNRVGAGWVSINMGGGGENSGWRGLEGVEAWWRKVGDGHPLRLWRIEADVEAPPPEVARRLLSERHLWDPALLKCRRLKISNKGFDDDDEEGKLDAELFQYVRASIAPLPPRDYCVLRGWRTDLDRGGCAVIEASVEHPAAPPLAGSVRGVVLASRYLVTPCGSGRSRIIHLSRVDAKGRTPDWYKRSYAHQVAYHLARIRESFRHVASGPESKV
ncbi:rho GTPase-activating protein 7 isoform X2 [Ischnura elegans]|uniref:rho GTPase-activating protein 7 isoform X2 n=1 Tax=Ischnura elegans TaxID=197161 RepID=UPI001ED86B45|nr:rho GTPase-activating protein 7 isoform X2 [Ischnura elegans]